MSIRGTAYHQEFSFASLFTHKKRENEREIWGSFHHGDNNLNADKSYDMVIYFLRLGNGKSRNQKACQTIVSERGKLLLRGKKVSYSKGYITT